MKKIINLFLFFSMLFCFAGCSKTDISSHSSDITKTSDTLVTASKNNTESEYGADDILLSVLYNKKPFITAKGTTVYLKDYKPIYKYPEDVDYYEKDTVFNPRDYTYVDLDKDGKEELIVAESPYADTYLILHKENEKIYGYSLYIRWFEALKKDGSFMGSGGAQIHDYNTISFKENTYSISVFSKYYFIGENSDDNVFEINGKKVSLEEIKQFAEEWDKRPEAEWTKFEQTN